MKKSKQMIIFKILFQACGKEMAGYLLTMVCTAFSGPAMLFFRGRVIDAAISEKGILLLEMLYFGAVAFLTFLITYENSMGKQRMKRKLYGQFSAKVLEKFSKIQYSAYESEQTLDIIKRMGNAPQENILQFFNAFLELFSEIISALCYAAVFASLSVWCMILGLSAFGVMLFFDFRRMRIMANLYDEQTQEERLMESYEQMLGNKAVVYDLRVADAVDFLLKKRKELSDSIVKERYRRTIQSQLVYEYGDLVVVAWMAIVLLFLVDSFIKGALTIGLFITLVGALQQIIDSFRKIGDEYSELQRRIMFVDYYLSFMRLEETAERGSGDLELEEEGVRFEHVTFTYPGKTEPALRDVSFVMKPRTRMALVGENGSGKSTLIKLMCGLYKPDSGRILINGRDTAELDSRALIRNFSVIFQDYGRYFFTVQENVELGDIDKMCRSQEQREPEVKAALHEGLSDELAERLRQPLGNLSEDGIELSGGQWQRLALSRACYRDSEILILDEPTASLDPVAENELYANFIEMMKNRSCILISHRLAVARYVDRILVLQRGELIEDGDHESLMRKNGAYASMYYAQSHWYII